MKYYKNNKGDVYDDEFIIVKKKKIDSFSNNFLKGIDSILNNKEEDYLNCKQLKKS